MNLNVYGDEKLTASGGREFFATRSGRAGSPRQGFQPQGNRGGDGYFLHHSAYTYRAYLSQTSCAVPRAGGGPLPGSLRPLSSGPGAARLPIGSFADIQQVEKRVF